MARTQPRRRDCVIQGTLRRGQNGSRGSGRWSVGLGYATPLLVGSRLYLFTRQGEEEEVCRRSMPAPERRIWRTSLSCPI